MNQSVNPSGLTPPLARGARSCYARSGIHLLLFAALLLISGAAAAVEILKSPGDHRAYRYEKLANGLQVLLISDPQTDKSAASVDVRVGSGSDPDGRAGLAHFLEHMLFLGTEKYPRPDAYQKYISSHGGSQNAYTSHEHTNYYFDIDPAFLEPALDRFAQFFTKPLFNPEFVQREMQAVNSEFSTQKQNDGWRGAYANKHGYNPRHPLSRFATGNVSTLADRPGEPIRDELIKFYERHYSANIMTLAVLGKEPLNVLSAWVHQRFASVPNIDAHRSRPEIPLFAPNQLPMRLDLRPIKEMRRLSLTFAIPPTEAYFRDKPAYYLSNLLGHEGKGSVLSALKKLGWAERLSAGYSTVDPDNGVFTVDIRLTPAGLERVDDVIATVFEYLRLIERSGIQRWVFDEQRRLFDISFRFEEESSAADYVRSLASDLHRYPPAEILHASYLLESFNEQLIRRYLAALKPENLMVKVTAKGLPVDQRDPWLGFEYRLRKVPATTVATWVGGNADAALSLPAPNAFIPDDLSVKPLESASPKPVEVDQTPGYALWYKQDDRFREPRADFYFTVKSPRANSSPRNSILTAALIEMLNEQLNELSYPADIAGLTYSLYTHLRGFSVRVSGYNDKQDVLLRAILKAINNPEFDSARFAVVKRKLLRRYANRAKNSPYNQAMSTIIDLILKPHWSDQELTAVARQITLADVKAFVPRLLSSVDILAMAHGNLLKSEAMRLGALVRQALATPADPASAARGAIAKLRPGRRYVYNLNVDHNDSAVVDYLQGDDTSFRTRARSSLLVQILGSPFFAQLRTRQQLGYVVFATSMTLIEAPGIAFVVQSPNATPKDIAERIDQFITEYATTLDAMSEAEFDKQKQALITKLGARDKTMSDVSDRYWNELDRRQLSFDTREQLIAAARGIQLVEFRRFYRDYLLNPSAKGILVQSLGTARKSAADALVEGDQIVEPAEFKREQPRFPDVSLQAPPAKAA